MTDPVRSLLGGISAQAFLRGFWQKRHRLVRRALPNFHSFVDRDELFDLACRDDVESRLVLERGGEYPWQVIHGPFRARLPATAAIALDAARAERGSAPRPVRRAVAALRLPPPLAYR